MDVDAANAAGHTVFQLAEAALQRQQAAAAAQDLQQEQAQQQEQGGGSPGRSGGSGSGRGGGRARADDFAERLRYEMMGEDPEAAQLEWVAARGCCLRMLLMGGC